MPLSLPFQFFSNLLNYFLVIRFSLDSPILCLFGWNSPFFESLDYFHHFAQLFGAHVFRSAAIHQLSSHSLPRVSRTLSAPCRGYHLPVRSSGLVMTSQMATSPFSLSFRQDLWSITSAWHFHVFVSFFASHTLIPVRFRAPLCSMLHSLPPLVNETPLFLRFGLDFSTIFPFLHHAMEAGCIVQGYMHLLSLLLRSFSSRFCPKAFIQHCSCLCQLISLLISFRDEPFNFCHLFFFFLRMVCLNMCHFHQDASLTQFMEFFFPNFYPQVCISGSWL